MGRAAPTPVIRPTGAEGPPRRSRLRRCLRALLVLALVGGAVLGSLVWLGVLDGDDWARAVAATRRRAHALGMALSEKVPVYRAQLQLTTCDLPNAGTDNGVLVKLNADHSTWLDYSHDDFERGASFTYDLGLEHVDVIGDVTRLEIAKPGGDAWCLRDLSLVINNDPLFTRHYPLPGRWLGAATGSTLTFRGTQLRRHLRWRAYRPSLPPSRIELAEFESRIESAVGNALRGQQVTWRRRPGRAVELTRAGRLGYRGVLHLEARLDNWPDPEIDATFRLAISCRAGELAIRVRQLRFDVSSPWYSDLMTLGILDSKIEAMLRDAVDTAALTRRTTILVCPAALGIAPDGALIIY